MIKSVTLKVGTIAFSLLSLSGVHANPDQKQIEADVQKRVAVIGEKKPKISIPQRMAEIQLPGASIAVIKNGELAWAAGYGIANSDTGAKVDKNTLFQAGSISKPVAALAALKLVEQGKIGLDEDVNPHLKGWQVKGDAISKSHPVTLRQLLNHTAGLTVHGFPGYALGEDIPSTVEVLQGKGNTDEVTVDTTPGTEWRYSGGGYTVMQKLVEDITGKPFAEYTDKHILHAMGMMRSTYRHDLPEELKTNASSAFDRDGDMYETVYNYYPEKAAAGLWTTPSDIAKYVLHMQQIMNGKSDGILQKDTVKAMFELHQKDWGLGPQMSKAGEQLLFGHGGKNLGFTNDFKAFVNQGDAIIVMTNGDGGGELIGELMITISEHYQFDIAKKKSISVFPLSDDQRRGIAGDYKMITDIGYKGEFIIEVREKDGQLMIDDPFVETPQRIVATSELAFVNALTGNDFVFNRNGGEKVTGLTINGRFELQKK